MEDGGEFLEITKDLPDCAACGHSAFHHFHLSSEVPDIEQLAFFLLTCKHPDCLCTGYGITVTDPRNVYKIQGSF